MAEEMTNQEQEATLGMEQDYIDTIKKMKETSISIDEYTKLQNENRRLLDAVVNGKQEAEEESKPKFSHTKEELRKNLYSENCQLSNLDYWKQTLELRDMIIDEGGKDPFLPYGEKIAPTAEDVQKAQQVAEIVQECIDSADGDSRVFTAELQRRTVDTGAPRRRR